MKFKQSLTVIIFRKNNEHKCVLEVEKHIMMNPLSPIY